MTFKPNKLTFAEGLKRIENAFAKEKMKYPTSIITSRDANLAKVCNALKVDNVPLGFKKWQLPVHLEMASQFFISVGVADTAVPLHSHDEGDGFRLIMSGTIIYNGIELTEGDWMFIPKGKSYDFKVGEKGVTLFYCYSCCCA
ncbi:cupin domain-containing protein [Enterobacter sp. 170198]|uniref:Cupin domain-containing protein n=1 Tax=Enterobacter chinensis TaxID=3030997 RepID=A0ABU5CZ87_9ENTR|nr:cupin domain-containing protein [Enterobacter sp. 170198]MDY0417014.1 cupin domain-containing protein [Enterobacter sp. 170198]